MQVLLSGAELGCSQEALTVVALASTDPIYFAPRCVLTAALLLLGAAVSNSTRICHAPWPDHIHVQERAGQCCAGMEALSFPDRGPHHKDECIHKLHRGIPASSSLTKCQHTLHFALLGWPYL